MDNEKLLDKYIDLWKSENPIKTAKLMAYFAVQPLLALGITHSDSPVISCYFFSFLGILFSIWWMFCIGRTLGYQKLWKKKIIDIGCGSIFPNKEDKGTLPFYGRVPSNWILLSPPVIGALIWLIILVFICGRQA